MLVIALIAFVGTMCWLLFNLAVYALPFFTGLSAGMFAYHSGAGPLGSIVIGTAIGAMTLVAGQVLFAAVRAPILHAGIAAAFAVPAAIAAYHAVHGISGVGGTGEDLRQIFGVVGALAIGGVAWARMNAFRPANRG